MKDYVPFLNTDALLGSSFTSRITQNIREDKGYTYSPGRFAPRSTACGRPPPAEELRAVEAYVAGLFVLRNYTREGIAEQLSFTDRQGIDRGYLTEIAP